MDLKLNKEMSCVNFLLNSKVKSSTSTFLLHFHCSIFVFFLNLPFKPFLSTKTAEHTCLFSKVLFGNALLGIQTVTHI